MGHRDDRARQDASAHRYLGKSMTNTALQVTLELAAKTFGFPVAVINIVDSGNQYTIAAVGAPLARIPRLGTLCDQVVLEGKSKVMFNVPPQPGVVLHLPVQTYVGVPLFGREGMVIGTLCLHDTKVRDFSSEQLTDLEAAGAVVQDQLELLRRLEDSPQGAITGHAELGAAVQKGEIIPYFQPIVDLKTNQVWAIEALARWQHPRKGLLAPVAFIALAEDSEIIIDLDLAILRQALLKLRECQQSRPDLRLNVNLSANHFEYPDCVDRITDSVISLDVDPATVNLEVTETGALAGFPADRDFLSELAERGFRIVLDDFGSGFAFVDHLLRLPINGIKLDPVLTASLGSRTGDAVAQSLLALATNLELFSIVEGIETQEQAHSAEILGAQYGQGFCWKKPMPPGQLANVFGSGYYQ